MTIADEQEDEVHDHPEILTSVETSATREELTERVGDLVARMEKAAPPDSLAPTEVKDTYRRLSELHHKLWDEEVSMGLDELETVEDYVDGCIDNIDEHLADIEEVLSLKSQVSDIREKKNSLENEVAKLETTHKELSERTAELKQHIGELEDDKDTFEQAYQYGREDATVSIPCSYCGEAVPIEPGNRQLEALREVVWNSHWGHTSCREQAQAQSNHRPSY